MPSKKKSEEEEVLDDELDDELDEVFSEEMALGQDVKRKPELSPETKRALRLRKGRKKRKFRRQEWFRYKRLGKKWRKPKGLHSKMRRKYKFRPKMPSIGYGSPRGARGLHPSGFREVLVHNVNDLEGIDKDKEAARIGGTVGMKKRIRIERTAEEMGIRVLNPGGI